MIHNDAVQVGQTDRDYADLDCSFECDAAEMWQGGIAWIVLAGILIGLGAL